MESYLAKLDPLVAALSVTHPGANYDRRGLGQLFGQLAQLMEDALGIKVGPYDNLINQYIAAIGSCIPSLQGLQAIASICRDTSGVIVIAQVAPLASMYLHQVYIIPKGSFA